MKRRLLLLAVVACAIFARAQQIQISGGVQVSGTVSTNTTPQVVTPQPLNVTPAPLPSGTTGNAYGLNGQGVDIGAANGTGPYTCSITGSLPSGLALSSGTTNTDCHVGGTPTLAGTSNFTINVTDAKSVMGTLSASIVIASTLAITQTTIPAAVVGTAYSQTLLATGGSGSGYAFTISAGTLPPGLSLVSPTISGTPTQAGSFPLTVLVTDDGANTAPWNFTITVNPAVVSGSADNRYCGPGNVPANLSADGPVSTPLTQCVYSPVSATPSPGTTRTTTAANFQATYNAASCGDTIIVTAGTTTSTQPTLTKACDSAHWLTIEGSGVSNINFPAEGTRSSPCFSNASSLPNRPAFPCSGGPYTLTAQFVALSSQSAMLIKGASYHRFIGIEFTRVTTPKSLIFSLVDLSSTGTQSNHIIFDRCWIHGVNADGTFPQTSTTDTSTTRGIWLGQSNNIAVIDSYLSDFYDNGATASNGNTDAQAIGGGGGGIANSGWGNYKFVNNHIEGASEGIILGGSNGPQLTPTGCTQGVNCNLDVPTNVEVRRNLFFAPNSWNGNTSTINSTGWPNRKNGIEFKVGANILLEANVMENCWYSSQPFCYVFDFAPKNSKNASNLPTDPTALVQDFVARYNYGYNYPGHQIALYSTMDAGCSNCTTLARRGSIHDNLVGDSLNKGSLTQGGFACVEFLADAGPITNVSMRHNTCVASPNVLMIIGATGTGQFDQIVWQDNLMAEGAFGVQAGSNSNAGCDNGGTGHAVYDSTNDFLGILNACVNGTTNTWTADHNGTWGSNAITNWPPNNTLKANIGAVGFTTVPGNNASGFPDSGLTPLDYGLTLGSAFHHQASDGADPGANIVQLNSEISGVASY